MDVLVFTEARARLGAVLEAVVTDHNPVVVARRKGVGRWFWSHSPIGVSWKRSPGRLLSTPRNTSRLTFAVDQLDTGGDAPGSS